MRPALEARRVRLGPGILLVALIGCSRTPADVGEPTTVAVAPVGSAEVVAEEAGGGLLRTDRSGVVGLLVKNEERSIMHPSAYCVEDGERLLGAPARIGELNVFTDAAVDGLVGEIVLARGSVEPSLLSALTEAGLCDEDAEAIEMPQMRSDWVAPEGGFRTTRARLAALPFLRATELAAIDLGEMVALEGDRVTVELRNPFDVPMRGLTVRAHYEGGPGKPMPRFEPLSVDVKPGGRQRLDLAAYVEAGPAGQDEGEPRGIYRLESVDLEGRLGQVELDVSIVVSVPRKR